MDHRQCYVGIRQGHPSIHYKGEDVSDIDAIIPRIGASLTFYGSAIVRQFEVMGVISANPSQAITRSRDKLGLAEITPITSNCRTMAEVMGVISANPSQAITRSRDKLRCMQILS